MATKSSTGEELLVQEDGTAGWTSQVGEAGRRHVGLIASAGLGAGVHVVRQ